MRINIREMRKGPIDTIFTPVQQDIFEATFLAPEKWWYLSELAVAANRTVSSLQRDLNAFTAGGILETQRDAGRVFFRASKDSLLFAPLMEIVKRSLGIERQVGDAFEPLANKIEALFIYGSVARGEDGPQSDVDLMCIGSVRLSDAAKVLRSVEKRTRREINVICYSSKEFSEKLERGDHFLSSLRKEPKIFILGNENVVGRRSRKREQPNR